MNKSSGHKHDGTTSEGPKIATLSSPVTGDLTFPGNITFSNAITIPETPTSDTDAASKGYVDGAWKVGQIVYTLETAYTEGTTKLADLGDDIPQQTDGTEIMTRSITPTSATNGLLINVVLNIGSNAGTHVIGCLFQDSTADALASWMCLNDAAGYGHQIVMQYYMVAGTTSETTFKVRVGNHNASDEWNVNGSSSGRLFGGTAISSITITEIAV